MKEENFESYSLEEEENEECLTMWSILPRIMAMPQSGWELCKLSGPVPEIAVLRFLLPLCLLAGGAEFMAMLYQVQLTFEGVLVNAVISFFSFFLGYYIAVVLAKVFLPKDAKEFITSKYGRLMAIAGVSTLAFFHILFQSLPMFDFIIEFFPLWTIFLIFKGMQIADVPKEKAAFSLGVMCLAIISSPYLVEWALSLFA